MKKCRECNGVGVVAMDKSDNPIVIKCESCDIRPEFKRTKEKIIRDAWYICGCRGHEIIGLGMLLRGLDKICPSCDIAPYFSFDLMDKTNVS